MNTLCVPERSCQEIEHGALKNFRIFQPRHVPCIVENNSAYIWKRMVQAVNRRAGTGIAAPVNDQGRHGEVLAAAKQTRLIPLVCFRVEGCIALIIYRVPAVRKLSSKKLCPGSVSEIGGPLQDRQILILLNRPLTCRQAFDLPFDVSAQAASTVTAPGFLPGVADARARDIYKASHPLGPLKCVVQRQIRPPGMPQHAYRRRTRGEADVGKVRKEAAERVGTYLARKPASPLVPANHTQMVREHRIERLHVVRKPRPAVAQDQGFPGAGFGRPQFTLIVGDHHRLRHQPIVAQASACSGREDLASRQRKRA